MHELLALESGNEILAEFHKMFQGSEFISLFTSKEEVRGGSPKVMEKGGIWASASDVFPVMDLEKFSFPINVIVTDMLDDAPALRSGSEYTEEIELRGVLVATIKDTSLKDDTLPPFHGDYDKIDYQLHLFYPPTEDGGNYEWNKVENLLDLIPKGMMELNETTTEGQESNKTMREMEEKYKIQGGKVTAYIHTVNRLRKEYAKDEKKKIRLPLEIMTTFNVSLDAPLTRKVFKTGADKKVYEIENLYTYMDNNNIFVWIPQMRTGLLNWVFLP